MAKFLSFMRLSAQMTFTDRKNLLLTSLISVFSLFIVVFLWQGAFQSADRISGYSFGSMVLYIFVVNTLYDFVNTSFISYRVSDDIRLGKLSTWLIWPYPHFLSQFGHACGSKFVKIPITIVLNCAAGFLLYRMFSGHFAGGMGMRVTLLSVVYFMFFLLLSFLWNFIADYLLGLVGFWMDNPWIIFYIKSHVSAVFCGLIIPINLFPGWIQSVLNYLPFQYYAYYPFQVLMGQVNTAGYIRNLSLFIGWIAVLALATYITWKKSISRFTASGG